MIVLVAIWESVPVSRVQASSRSKKAMNCMTFFCFICELVFNKHYFLLGESLYPLCSPHLQGGAAHSAAVVPQSWRIPKPTLQ